MKGPRKATPVGFGRGLRAFVLAAAACAALQLGGAATASAGTLDQQQPTYGGVSQSIYADDTMPFSESSLAQTFTAGITGDLDQVDLYLQKFGAPAAPLTVEIRDTVGVGGPPGDTVLATESVPATSVPAAFDFVQVPLDPPVPVTAGTRYAIVAWTNALFAAPYSWGELNASPYAGGELRVQQAPEASPPVSGQWGGAGMTDTTFKTYVEETDADSDGSPISADCNDANPAIHPGAAEIPGNGIDEDCSGADAPAAGGGAGASAATTPAASPTGQRAAALAKCKKKKGNARKKCKKRANKLPV